METYLYKDETCRIIGACFEVYNEMGCGFLESVYQERFVCTIHRPSSRSVKSAQSVGKKSGGDD